MKKTDRKKIETWLITGCATGFGRELCLELLNRGYKVVATARDVNKLDYLKDKDNGENLLLLPLDITDKNQVNDVINKSIDRFGKIDVLVNNAGSLYLSSFETEEEEKSRILFETNFWSVIYIIKAILPHMKNNNNGTIVNMSSTVGILANMGCPMYAATKHALEAINEALRREIKQIRIMAVEPCNFKTDVRYKAIGNNGLSRDDVMNGYDNQEYYNDTAAGAKIIINAVESRKVPRRLLLGSKTYNSACKAIKLLKKDKRNYKKYRLPCVVINNMKIKLFNRITIIKIKRDGDFLKYYLFGFLLIFKGKFRLW